MTSGDKTGAGDETSSSHNRTEASAVDDRLVVDWTASSSRGVDDHLADKNFNVFSFDLSLVYLLPLQQAQHLSLGHLHIDCS